MNDEKSKKINIIIKEKVGEGKRREEINTVQAVRRKEEEKKDGRGRGGRIER